MKQFEQELLREDWQSIRDGLQVKLCPSSDGEETFILCRSRDRGEKEKAMHERFEKRIEERLKKIETSCSEKKCEPVKIATRVGKLIGRNTRAAGLGSEPRRVSAELEKITVVDVVLPTRSGVEIRRRCVTRPSDHQAILLQRLGLQLPTHLENTTM